MPNRRNGTATVKKGRSVEGDQVEERTGSGRQWQDGREIRCESLFQKTKMCHFYMVGTCNRGESCSFAHTCAQLKEKPDFAKTRMCKSYLKSGRCQHGDGCNFAHDKEELRRINVPKKESMRAGSVSHPMMPGIENVGAYFEHGKEVSMAQGGNFTHEKEELPHTEVFSEETAPSPSMSQSMGHSLAENMASSGQVEVTALKAEVAQLKSQIQAMKMRMSQMKDIAFHRSVPTPSDSQEQSSGMPAGASIDISVRNTFLHFEDASQTHGSSRRSTSL
eukprot:TRINITY_DN45036_c0_g1_i1.p1 TRINITY_DN45036_c0_g1~~TRINITY_DN45036_c0_g1_i1.p1  ORF type:complete len:277 (+),score=46.33 TRINITY_DN45036_c0_g1_i1:59-889(+)